MNNLLRIRPILTISSRLKSRQSDPKRVGEALKQFNRENKAQFGELIKKGKRKTKSVVSASKCNAIQLQMIIADAQAASISAENSDFHSLNDPYSETNRSNSSVTNGIQLESNTKDDLISRKKKSSKQKLENTTAESSCEAKSSSKSKRKPSKKKLEKTMAESSREEESSLKSRRKSSKQELESKVAESSSEDKHLKRKTPRKVKTAAKKSSLSDESATLETAEITQTAEKEQIENPDPVADSSRINVYVEESSQSCDVSLSETNENVANASSILNIDDENDVPTASTSSKILIFLKY